ncbi:hypothetical protein ACFL23_03120 [Patescibacteria group bacterium]
MNEIPVEFHSAIADKLINYGKMEDVVRHLYKFKELEKDIAADNIEVAPNFKNNPQKDEILKYIYKDFFKDGKMEGYILAYEGKF